MRIQYDALAHTHTRSNSLGDALTRAHIQWLLLFFHSNPTAMKEAHKEENYVTCIYKLSAMYFYINNKCFTRYVCAHSR